MDKITKFECKKGKKVTEPKDKSQVAKNNLKFKFSIGIFALIDRIKNTTKRTNTVYRFLNNVYCNAVLSFLYIPKKHTPELPDGCQSEACQKQSQKKRQIRCQFHYQVRYSLLTHSSSLVEKRTFFGGGEWGVLLDCFVVVVVDSLTEN